MTVERWGVFELDLDGPAHGNPYTDVRLSALFQYRNRVVEADGFYDGDGRHRIRFMPDREGTWHYVTRSDVPELDGRQGTFECVPPGVGNHGPVRVAGTGFAYADGTRYLPLGTTCYHWTHDGDEAAEELTLRSLAASPFTKVRMCLLPTRHMRPPLLAFPGDTPGALDRTRIEPRFFARFERRVRDLLALGIVADVILFHPYDEGHWGVDDMSREQDLFLLRHTLARLSAYRNVWWSIANEYDFNRAKTVEDWDLLGRFVQRNDPYQRPRSIHNGTRMYAYERIYDFARPWITHQSIQHWDARLTGRWMARCPKPVVIDEIGYEGLADRRWGNLTARALTRQFWHAAVAGGYVGHGECYPDADLGGATWISRGGRLRGESVPRVAFLRRLLEEGPADLPAARRRGEYWLEFFGDRRPAHRDVPLPPGAAYRVDLVDTWDMTVTALEGTHRDHLRVALNGRPDMALRIRRAE
ncbi:DUF5060 domain-containing protein [Streptomyces sp. SBT349]|uniref:DUF5060 domain-containing protein n=1 Tax=Streptomyces sp. SBT349 TaxID=1580539 RepID=UPI00066DE714|nr:DUF5060 domain-containing protein [Streptomyces sp. SBT349]